MLSRPATNWDSHQEVRWPRKHGTHALLLFVTLLGGGGCAGARQRLAAPVNVCGQRGLIFAVDGAGDFHASSEALADAVAAARLPLAVVSFEWSHGYGRFIADRS